MERKRMNLARLAAMERKLDVHTCMLSTIIVIWLGILWCMWD
jgi:hypothetical protein